ncbi:type III pantothenate kinase [Alkanindiges sp. WGS2144]|uniref:type III pantothenate kinase n=1 Tax=Alkanindiges sp. WGS2144 TaxID=3366808 RepID=UPI0037502871
MRQLWLDIGNTRLKYWLTVNGEMQANGAELHLQSPADLLLGLVDRFAHFSPHEIGISSVLDEQSHQRVQHILGRLHAPVRFAQVKASHQGLQTGYDQPAQLGIDRWLQVLALAGQNKQYCIIGCGTALTIDLLDNNQHLGGYILPSLYLQRDSLTQGTKGIKIPEQAFSDLYPGRNTSDAVHHGILLGLLGAIEKIIQHNPARQIVLTGGDAPIFASFLQQKTEIILEPDLLLKGLMRFFAT